MTIKTGDVLRPAAGSYIVLLDPTPDKTEGGLHLVHTGKDESDDPWRQMGVVLGVGASYTDRAGTHHTPECSVGDRIVYLPTSIYPIPHKSRRLGAIPFSSVICRFVEPNEDINDEIDCIVPDIA